MRADCFHEPQNFPDDLGVKVQAAFLSVIIQIPFNRQLNVAACDDLTAQNGARGWVFQNGCEARSIQFHNVGRARRVPRSAAAAEPECSVALRPSPVHDRETAHPILGNPCSI